jgi:hypothetical protein
MMRSAMPSEERAPPLQAMMPKNADALSDASPDYVKADIDQRRRPGGEKGLMKLITRGDQNNSDQGSKDRTSHAFIRRIRRERAKQEDPQDEVLGYVREFADRSMNHGHVLLRDRRDEKAQKRSNDTGCMLRGERFSRHPEDKDHPENDEGPVTEIPPPIHARNRFQ